VQDHMKQGISLAPGMEIGYVIRDARKWEVDSERTASEFETWKLLPVSKPNQRELAGGREPRIKTALSYRH
jgi:hypothetical protein